MADTLTEPCSTDLTWDEAHHRLIPLLRANDFTNVFYILGEYVGRIFEQAKERPLYVFKDQSDDGALPTARPSQREAA